ncbi:WXG100 family type VII secretion target [Corynebacterium breve]|uniref:ESAT-6-like protein n=1 Tax=Corynebacterium breve TaxID=3049799 RepID=A0ABY8VEQ6_9CORY|nr:WXG100 family type VII secretion target [Corynebacterium breve]WIM68139.1 WXG100 family type VII secretion target [Corynebacterium breve]
MSAPIQYGFGKLNGLADDINASSTNVGTELNELKDLLRPIAETWTGDAAEAYQAHQDKWDSAATELNNILNTIGNAVRDGASRMQTINSNAADSWRG